MSWSIVKSSQWNGEFINILTNAMPNFGRYSPIRIHHNVMNRREVMAKYLFVFHGGKMATNPADAKKAMEAWGQWFGSLGKAVIDGGNPVGKSSTVKSDGSLVSDGGANPASGYSLIEAPSLEEAHKKAKGCPILANGGSIEIAEAMDM
jgi:hypothetical protein